MTRPLPAQSRAGARQDALEVAARALARELDQAELRDRQHARARAVPRELRLEALEDLAAVLGLLHVDEVDDEQAAEVPQADLPRDLRNGLEVRREHRLLEAVLADEAAPC